MGLKFELFLYRIEDAVDERGRLIAGEATADFDCFVDDDGWGGFRGLQFVNR